MLDLLNCFWDMHAEDLWQISSYGRKMIDDKMMITAKILRFHEIFLSRYRDIWSQSQHRNRGVLIGIWKGLGMGFSVDKNVYLCVQIYTNSTCSMLFPSIRFTSTCFRSHRLQALINLFSFDFVFMIFEIFYIHSKYL